MYRPLELGSAPTMRQESSVGRWPRLPRRWIALAGFVALYVLWQASGWNPVRRELAGGIFLLLIALAAAAASYGASRRAAGASRWAWRLVTLAILGQSLGQGAQLVMEGIGVSAYPSLADPLYLSFYPLLLAGVLRFPVVRRSRREALELVLDCAIVTLGGGAVFLYMVIGPDVIAASTPLETLVSVAYPVGDLILLVALGTVLLRGAAAETARSLRPMALAIGLFALADLVYGYTVLHGTYSAGDPTDTLYVLAFACFVVAASRQGTQDGAKATVSAAAVTGGALWLPYLGITAAGAITVAKELNQPFFPDLGVALAVALIGFLVVARQALSHDRVRRSLDRLAQAQEIARVGSWEWDVERDVVERSEVDLKLYGLDVDTPAMTKAEALSPIEPKDRERINELVDAVLRDGGPFSCEVHVRRADGELRTMFTRGETARTAGRLCIRGTHQDITERKNMEIELQFQADHDPLTGLCNRRRLAEQLEVVLRSPARDERVGALLMLDLDDFKVLNDTCGHAAGDSALKVFAQAIEGLVRAGDTVARIGGDEFAVLLCETGKAEAFAVAERIREGAELEMDRTIHITGGLVTFGGWSELTASDALIAADIALYEAKEAGKDRLQLYHGSAGAAVTWVERIRLALAEDRFVLYEQPMFDLHTNSMAHSELLIRMISDSGEVIAPSAFLPTAERFGLINEIDRWVTREGLRLAEQGKRVSINLSAQSIGDECILESLTDALDAGVDPDDVIFEITESAAMGNMDEARTFAEALTDLGCELALDDFGTGFGSFTYLKHLPAHYLKIDMEFVREMVFNETDRQVVNSIVKVAHSLGKLTIAEGVEDAATLQALREFGVDRVQGYFVGRPSPPEARTSRQVPAQRGLAKIGA
ncbi:MAG: putative bifunctional diguanylate cyclase/phosphodiesterase [Solirubrobacteraceae bacterium]